MTIKKFISSAIKGGWKIRKDVEMYWETKTESWWYKWMSENEDGELCELTNPACLDHPHYFYQFILDPKAWEAVGKAEGWEEKWMSYDYGQSFCISGAEHKMHQMIDALCEGNTLTDFIEIL